MAEVYFGTHRQPDQLEKIIALHVDVQAELDAQATWMLAKASALLESSPNRTGNAQVGIDRDNTKVDRYIYLEDPGQWVQSRGFEYYTAPAADHIEFRNWILHDATGLPRP